MLKKLTATGIVAAAATGVMLLGGPAGAERPCRSGSARRTRASNAASYGCAVSDGAAQTMSATRPMRTLTHFHVMPIRL